ncbi:MAG: GntR family transcriptional regulator [Cypionkella sp.]|uniref:GntR family transcriptional regulator n=1 Tax=Cypionkella sp. TaxID=2811411 RepID=UPI002AB80128|nr:GntR family transcriptional regulator [Cypionkella sp.]MDZ4310242.1 GntR family transcriptional regulator [Cypionkella sp.]MDZ4392456.1 GntR family transcriptional regulator [Cypionkella sp.]
MRAIPNALRIRNALENAIVQGVYAPGERLDPEALEREFDCSRTPIREALYQLESSGLVRVMPKRGTFVTSWTAEQLAERFEVMAETEATCGRLAARRITESELVEFEIIHARCRELAEAGDTEGYYRHNSLFHHCIYRATHNAFLEHEAARLHAMLQPYRRMQLRVRNRMSRSYSEHDTIVAAIRAGDAEAAATALREHVIVQGDRFHDLLSALRQAGEKKVGR